MELTVQQRRKAFFGLLAVAVVAFLVALVATLAAVPNAGAWLVGAVILLMLALGGEIVLLVWGETKRFDDEGEWYAWENEARRAQEVILRCSNCRETFTLMDTGERPLRHACPHCGVTGVLKEPARAATAR